MNGDTDVSEVHFGFVFTSDLNRVTLHRTIERSSISAIQPTFTRFPQPEMDSASTVTKRPSLFRDVTQRWLLIGFRRFRALCCPHFQGSSCPSPLQVIWIGCPETSLTDNQPTFRNMSEERIAQLHRGRSFNSRN